jgi:hypothetical protein
MVSYLGTISFYFHCDLLARICFFMTFLFWFLNVFSILNIFYRKNLMIIMSIWAYSKYSLPDFWWLFWEFEYIQNILYQIFDDYFENFWVFKELKYILYPILLLFNYDLFKQNDWVMQNLNFIVSIEKCIKLTSNKTGCKAPYFFYGRDQSERNSVLK